MLLLIGSFIILFWGWFILSPFLSYKKESDRKEKEPYELTPEELENLIENSVSITLGSGLQLSENQITFEPPHHARNKYFGDACIVEFIKTHPNAIIPTKAHLSDAGADMTAVGVSIEGDVVTYNLGVAIKLPPGHCAFLMPRSSIYKQNLQLCNSIGLIDESFVGTIQAKFRITKWNNMVPFDSLYPQLVLENIYKIGDKVAQLVILPIPSVTYKEVSSLEDTDRGSGGFGSSGI